MKLPEKLNHPLGDRPQPDLLSVGLDDFKVAPDTKPQSFPDRPGNGHLTFAGESGYWRFQIFKKGAGYEKKEEERTSRRSFVKASAATALAGLIPGNIQAQSKNRRGAARKPGPV